MEPGRRSELTAGEGGESMRSVVDTARDALTGKVVAGMSSLVHESETHTRMVFEQAVPVSVAGLARTASTEAGARALLQSFQRADHALLEPRDLGRTVADPLAAEQVASSGEGLTGRLFGNKLDAVVDDLAAGGGVSRSAASRLLGLATPLVMGIVGKTAVIRNLDPLGLARFLGEQLRLAGGTIPGHLPGVLSLSPALAGAGGAHFSQHPQRMVEIPHERSGRSILPWLVVGLAVLAVVLWLAGRGRRPHEGVTASRPVPTGTMAPPPAPALTTSAPAAPPTIPPATPQPVPAITAGDGVATFTRALETSEPLPARFTVPALAFEHNSAGIEPSSAGVLDQVAGVLLDHPRAKLRIEGYTDASGTADGNLTLSQQRAESVRAYIADQGVSSDRLEAIGFGATRPVADEDSPAGRAQNRRIELVVLER
jgi:OOP family OmpA-OmpF porin